LEAEDPCSEEAKGVDAPGVGAGSLSGLVGANKLDPVLKRVESVDGVAPVSENLMLLFEGLNKPG
jgi:hypothetical protein